jgi:hypothetical protein
MDYGARASADLIVTRGKGFTKEKNKKKRGSYRGGVRLDKLLSFSFDQVVLTYGSSSHILTQEITMASHSIKFT